MSTWRPFVSPSSLGCMLKLSASSTSTSSPPTIYNPCHFLIGNILMPRATCSADWTRFRFGGAHERYGSRHKIRPTTAFSQADAPPSPTDSSYTNNSSSGSANLSPCTCPVAGNHTPCSPAQIYVGRMFFKADPDSARRPHSSSAVFLSIPPAAFVKPPYESPPRFSLDIVHRPRIAEFIARGYTPLNNLPSSPPFSARQSPKQARHGSVRPFQRAHNSRTGNKPVQQQSQTRRPATPCVCRNSATPLLKNPFKFVTVPSPSQRPRNDTHRRVRRCIIFHPAARIAGTSPYLRDMKPFIKNPTLSELPSHRSAALSRRISISLLSV